MEEKFVAILATQKLLRDSNKKSQQHKIITLSFPCPSYSNFRKIHFQGVVLSASSSKIADPGGHMFQIEPSPLNFRGSASDNLHQQQGLSFLRSTLYSFSISLPGRVFKVAYILVGLMMVLPTYLQHIYHSGTLEGPLNAELQSKSEH